MKHHLTVQSNPTGRVNDLPFWGDVASGQAMAVKTFSPEVDALFSDFGIEFSVTAEYKKKEVQWTPEETRANFDKHFRFILLNAKEIPSDLVNKLRLLPNIVSVKPGHVISSDLPKVSKSQSRSGYGLDDARKAIGLDETLLKTTGHADVKIAVLDTGVDTNHPELEHCMLPGFDFVNIISGSNQFVGDYLGYDQDPDDEVGHGTHVAGIICGKGKNMPKGVVPNCKIIPVRVLGAMKKGDSKVGAGLVGNINAGIKWAVDNGADVINMSLGIVHEGGGLPHEDVVNYAKDKGVTIVAATGNDGKNSIYFPSGLPHVISVGATDQSFQKVAPFSTYGDQVDFVAPGTEIYSTYLDGKYAFSTGTSHAAPFVAGAAAMLKSYGLQKGRKLKDHHVKYILKQTSDKVGTRLKDFKMGYGVVNLKDAIKLLEYKLNN